MSDYFKRKKKAIDAVIFELKMAKEEIREKKAMCHYSCDLLLRGAENMLEQALDIQP